MQVYGFCESIGDGIPNAFELCCSVCIFISILSPLHLFAKLIFNILVHCADAIFVISPLHHDNKRKFYCHQHPENTRRNSPYDIQASIRAHPRTIHHLRARLHMRDQPQDGWAQAVRSSAHCRLLPCCRRKVY